MSHTAFGLSVFVAQRQSICNAFRHAIFVADQA